MARSGTDFSHPDTFSFSSDCNSPLVVGIHGKDAGGPAAIIASIEHCGTTVISDRCFSPLRPAGACAAQRA
jgi:hypothetical protein